MKKYIVVVKDDVAIVIWRDTPTGRVLLQQADYVLRSYERIADAHDMKAIFNQTLGV